MRKYYVDNHHTIKFNKLKMIFSIHRETRFIIIY